MTLDARSMSRARAGAGGVLLVRPRPVLRALGGRAPDRASIIYARVLGVRHLAEALLILRHPTRKVVLAGVAVDAVHAISSVLLAERRHHRRLAAINAGVAAGMAVAGAATAR